MIREGGSAKVASADCAGCAACRQVKLCLRSNSQAASLSSLIERQRSQAKFVIRDTLYTARGSGSAPVALVPRFESRCMCMQQVSVIQQYTSRTNRVQKLHLASRHVFKKGCKLSPRGCHSCTSTQNKKKEQRQCWAFLVDTRCIPYSCIALSAYLDFCETQPEGALLS